MRLYTIYVIYFFKFHQCLKHLNSKNYNFLTILTKWSFNSKFIKVFQPQVLPRPPSQHQQFLFFSSIFHLAWLNKNKAVRSAFPWPPVAGLQRGLGGLTGGRSRSCSCRLTSHEPWQVWTKDPEKCHCSSFWRRTDTACIPK